MSKADFDDAIADIKNAAFSRQGLKGLRSIRALLIDVAFRQELEEIIARSHNQPEERAAIVAALAEIKFAFSDQRAERTEQHSQTGLVAIGGGVALSAGAILAAATQILTFAWLSVVPLAIGTYFGWQGSEANKRLALEISALNDIVEALDDRIRSVRHDD